VGLLANEAYIVVAGQWLEFHPVF